MTTDTKLLTTYAVRVKATAIVKVNVFPSQIEQAKKELSDSDCDPAIITAQDLALYKLFEDAEDYKVHEIEVEEI